jgi:hypothetical protein
MALRPSIRLQHPDAAALHRRRAWRWRLANSLEAIWLDLLRPAFTVSTSSSDHFPDVCLFRAIAASSPPPAVRFQAAAWYWHFVDMVWLFLFACIYVWGEGLVRRAKPRKR